MKALLLLGLLAPPRAAVFTWDGGGASSSWADPLNWDTDTVPPDDGTADVVFATGFVSGPAITLDGSRDVNSVTVTTTTLFSIDSGTPSTSRLRIRSGDVTRTTAGITTLDAPIAGLNGLTLTGSGPQTATNTGDRFITSTDHAYSGPTTLTNVVLRLVSGTGRIPDGSPLIVGGGAILDLNGRSSTVGSLAGAGQITNASPGIATLQAGGDGSDTLFSGTLGEALPSIGPGIRLWKIGAGTLTLSGANVHQGGTGVDGGTLLVTGSLFDGVSIFPDGTNEVTVRSGGTLGGNGSLGSIATEAGGTVSPGAVGGRGTLSTGGNDGDLRGGTLVIHVAGFGVPGVDYDLLDLGGGTFRTDVCSELVLDLAGLPTTGTAFGIVTYGAVGGVFAPHRIRLINNPSGFTATLAYGPASLDVTIGPPASGPPSPAIIIDPPCGLVTDESGGTASFTVALTTIPSAPVLLTFSNGDPTEGIVPNSSLVFRPDASALVPQTVTIVGQDDPFADGDVAYSILTAGAISGDPAYAGLDPPDVEAVNVDHDLITVTPVAGLITTETAGTATFTVTLGARPTQFLFIPVTSSDATEGQATPGWIIFPPGSLAGSFVTVTVTGIDDAAADGDATYELRVGPAVSAHALFAGAVGASVSVVNLDDETTPPPGFTLVETGRATAVTEGGGPDVYSIVLNVAPAINVTVTVTPDAQVTASTPSLLFTPLNWFVPQVVTVSAVDDAATEGPHAGTITHVASNGLSIPDVTVAVADNEVVPPPGILIAVTGAGTSLEEGGPTDDYDVTLSRRPDFNVTVTILPDAQATAAPPSLLFTPANWDVAQGVTLTAVDDLTIEGLHGSTIAHSATSADLSFDGILLLAVIATVADNDAPGPEKSEVWGGCFASTATGGGAPLGVLTAAGLALLLVGLRIAPFCEDSPGTVLDS